ncbi:MAG: hypothetical protein M9933_01740, partial [Chitinophagaceae bacterium]|nr:hypothetical protein [Chitinophagaceae bacterium]
IALLHVGGEDIVHGGPIKKGGEKRIRRFGTNLPKAGKLSANLFWVYLKFSRLGGAIRRQNSLPVSEATGCALYFLYNVHSNKSVTLPHLTVSKADTF